VRDARPEGREERGPGRDRDLAGRSPLIENVLRVAAAIGADALGFVLWNLTARSPLQLGRDIAAAFARPALLLTGAFHFAVGLLLITGGTLLLFPLVGRVRDFLVLETLALVAALAVDQLVGPELRRRLVVRT
jgi:hypothetical protein